MELSWKEHVAKFRADHPEVNKKVLYEAAKTYKSSKKEKGEKGSSSPAPIDPDVDVDDDSVARAVSPIDPVAPGQEDLDSATESEYTTESSSSSSTKKMKKKYDEIMKSVCKMCICKMCGNHMHNKKGSKKGSKKNKGTMKRARKSKKGMGGFF